MRTAEPPVFNLRPPDIAALPLVVSIPHAGTYIPQDIDSTLAGDHIRALPMTDWHLQHLYDFLPSLGVTTIYANYSRFVVDLNRAPDASSLYPGRFETGLVSLKTFQGEDIFSAPPGSELIDARRERYHRPYHARLERLLAEHRARFGRAFLIDAHSVASGANLLHPALGDDIYLGNRDGVSCDDWMIDLVDQAFSGAGYKVVRNHPYKGGYITDHYGQQPGVRALQVEMCQRLYMDEADPSSAPGLPQFTDMKGVLHEVFTSLIAAISERAP